MVQPLFQNASPEALALNGEQEVASDDHARMDILTRAVEILLTEAVHSQQPRDTCLKGVFQIRQRRFTKSCR